MRGGSLAQQRADERMIEIDDRSSRSFIHQSLARARITIVDLFDLTVYSIGHRACSVSGISRLEHTRLQNRTRMWPIDRPIDTNLESSRCS